MLLFRYAVFCRNVAKFVIFVHLSFHTIVVNNGLREPYLLLANGSFILLTSESHRGCLIWDKFVKKFKATCALFSDKACCFSQSERALYEHLDLTVVCQNHLQNDYDDGGGGGDQFDIRSRKI